MPKRFRRRGNAGDVPSALAAFGISYRLLEAASGRAFRGGQRGNFEERVTVEGGQHLLAGNPGGSDNCNWYFHRSFSFAPTQDTGDTIGRPYG